LSLNPFELSKTIDKKLNKIYDAASLPHRQAGKNSKIYKNLKSKPYVVSNSVPSNLWLHS